MNLTTPLVHPNGTSKKELLNGYTNAHSAVQKALEAVRQTVPNGRDYYPIEHAAYERARSEHLDRVSRLNAVAEELMALATAVYDQGNT